MRLLERCGTFDINGVSFWDRLFIFEIKLVYFFGTFVLYLIISTIKKLLINIVIKKLLDVVVKIKNKRKTDKIFKFDTFEEEIVEGKTIQNETETFWKPEKTSASLGVHFFVAFIAKILVGPFQQLGFEIDLKGFL